MKRMPRIKPHNRQAACAHVLCTAIAFAFLLANYVSTLTAAEKNPVAALYKDQTPAWTAKLAWDNTVNIHDFAGKNWHERLAAAQKALQAKGGGVVRFPAGTYEFTDDLVLGDGILLCGQIPTIVTDARDPKYALGTRFEFPLYKPKFEGHGTPNDTAFKGIRLAKPESDSNCGVLYVAIDRGHVRFDEAEDHHCGGNRLVVGNIITNAAGVADDVPRASVGQPAYHRWIARHRAAIHVYSAENLLVANNRLPKSGQSNFEMLDYVLAVKKEPRVHDLDFNPDKNAFTKVVVPAGVVFDYDNRPGIYANDFSIGAGGDGLPNGTPKEFPHGFRQGTVIRENYIYSHGRCPISFTGDGTQVLNNVIRIPDDIWRPTCRGFETSGGGSTNDNRAIQCRGYRYRVEGNDFQVYAGLAYDRKYRTCDGEGIMHENHVNAKVLDSRIANNRGNGYICVWRVEVDGLEIRGNKIEKTPGPFIGIHSAIACNGRKRFAGQPYCPVRNLVIRDNEVRGGAIQVAGENKGGNLVTGNKSLDPAPAVLINENRCAEVKDNENFEVFDSEAAARPARSGRTP